MANQSKSRWQDDAADADAGVQRKLKKEAKRRAKVEKHRRVDVTVRGDQKEEHNDSLEPAEKRRKLSNFPSHDASNQKIEFASNLLRFPTLSWGPCRHVDNFEKLNNIEEGSYGWVSRAQELATGEIVALKKLKLENAGDGFPVTGLREIQTLQASRHENIIALKEVVVGGENLSE